MRILNNIDKDQWEKFVYNFKTSNIFSSSKMLDAFEKSKGFEIFPRFVIDNNKIVAAAFPVLVKIHDSFLQRFTNRLILYSTPLYQNDSKGIEGLKLILNDLKELAKRKALFLEIRNSEKFPFEEDANLLSNFKYIPYQNYLVNLDEGKEILWSSLSTFTRNHIRKAEKKGVILKVAKEGELEEVVSLLETLYKNKNIPFLNRTLFFNAYKILNPLNHIRIICAEYESQIIGVRISLNYNKTLYDWYAASKSEFNNFYLNEALAWNSINWAIDNNYEIFDFGGGAIKGHYYGPAKFKEKFRGELVEYGRYRYIPNKFLYNVASTFYKIRTGNKTK